MEEAKYITVIARSLSIETMAEAGIDISKQYSKVDWVYS